MKRKGTALEQIFFQANSALGKALEQAFQKAITFRDSIDYDNIPDGEHAAHRRSKMHSYAKLELFPSMKKAIKDNTNIEITQIVDVESFCGYFAIDISLDSDADVAAIISNQTGTGVKSIPLDQSAQEIADLSKKFNEVDSKFSSIFFGKNLSRKISATLWMDVDMAFLMQDNLPHNVAESLTADELTAIYLHEVGHMCTMLAAAGNAYYQVERITSQLKTFQSASHDPKKFIETYTKSIRPNLNELTASKAINPKVLETADKIIDKIKYYESSKNDDYGFGTLELIYQMLVRYFWFIVMAWFRVFMLSYVRSIYLVLTLFISSPGEKGKVSDVANTNRNIYQLERAADEFVSRHGYGGSLAKGLVKITTAAEAIDSLAFSGGKVHSDSLRASKTFGRVLKFAIWVQRLFRLGSNQIVTDTLGGVSNYEGDVNRIKRIVQQINTAFKNTMSPAVAANYLSEYQAAIKALEEINTTSRKVSDFVWTYFQDGPAILDRFFQTDQDKVMEKMLDDIDEIINNSLYVRSAQFKHFK